MKIFQTQNNNKGAFYIDINNTKVAEVTYSIAQPNTLIIDHTEVNDDYRGKGLGNELIKNVITFSETHSYKILPLCPFANAYFKKHTEYNSLLK